MKKSDFLRILENFPGGMELKRKTSIKYKNFARKYFYIDFDKVKVELRKNGNVIDIPKSEKTWFKFLSFMVIFSGCCDDVPETEEFLKPASQKTAKKICSKFNEIFYAGENIILDVAEIHPNELIQFAKSGEPLL